MNYIQLEIEYIIREHSENFRSLSKFAYVLEFHLSIGSYS